MEQILISMARIYHPEQQVRFHDCLINYFFFLQSKIQKFSFFSSPLAADVQRLDLTDCNLYGESPSDPGPMVLCNQCNHIMAPEGIMRHVKRVHGSKIVPAPSGKLRIPTKGISTAGITMPIIGAPTMNRMTNNSLSTPQATESTLSTEFSNRLNVSKMAPPTPINSSSGKNFYNNDQKKTQTLKIPIIQQKNN